MANRDFTKEELDSLGGDVTGLTFDPEKQTFSGDPDSPFLKARLSGSSSDDITYNPDPDGGKGSVNIRNSTIPDSTPVPTTVQKTPEQIREDVTREAQDRIDSLTQLSNQQIQEIRAQQARTEEQRQAEGRGVNIRAGLAGSPYVGQQRTGITERVGQYYDPQVSAAQRQLQQNISNIKAGISQEVRDVIQFEREGITFDDTRKTTAAANFKIGTQEAGASGVSFDEYFTPEMAANAKKLGLDEFAMKGLFVGAIPDDEKVFEKVVGNTMFIGRKNPFTGEVTTEEITLPEGEKVSAQETMEFNSDTGQAVIFTWSGEPHKSQITGTRVAGAPAGFSAPVDQAAIDRQTARDEKTKADRAGKDALILTLQDKIEDINSILRYDDAGVSQNIGLKQSVGTGMGSFQNPLRKVFTGDAAEFRGAIQNLISQETLDALIGLKARGGTLGAISEKELDILEKSATKIAAWQTKMGSGRFEIKEDVFIAEIEKMKAHAQRAIDGLKAEQQEVDDFLNNIP